MEVQTYLTFPVPDARRKIDSDDPDPNNPNAIKVERFNVLDWWKSIGLFKFPNLAKLAQMVFSIPASSAPCERMFSTAAHIDRKERNRMNSENLSELIFAKAALQFENRFGKI